MKEQVLIFVYNANSDLLSSVTDLVHKILSPSTYNCNLCTLTYGNFSKRNEWKSFLLTLNMKTIFLHRDEFLQQYKIETLFPATFIIQDDVIKEIISQHEIENCKTLDELEDLIVVKLKEHVEYHHTNI
jgi:hypothetical protein